MRNPKILVASVLVTAALVTVATDIATATTTATSRKRLHSLNSVVSTSGYRVMRTEYTATQSMTMAPNTYSDTSDLS